MRPARALFRASLTVLLAGRRAVVLLVFAGATVLTTWLIAADSPAAASVDLPGTVRSLLLPLLVPLVSLTFGTAALGDELGDATMPNIVLKPIRRATILLAKLGSALTASLAVLLPAALAGHVLAAGGLGPRRLLAATLVAVAVSSVVYCAVGMALSLATRRALILGVAYMLLWEGTLVGLAPGLAAASARGYSETLFTAVHGRADAAFLALGPFQATVSALAVSIAAISVAVRRLERIDLD